MMRATAMALIAAATLPMAATIPGSAAAQQQAVLAPVLPDGTLLDVVAEGKSTRVPDLATIGAGVVTQASSAAEALAANARAMEGVLAALKRAGVAERDVQTARIALNPQYRYGENQPPIITGYQASNRVTVRFRDIDRSGTILDALVKAGANQINGPDLELARPDAAMDEARADAVARARARAELYAKAAGLRVDRIVSISENGDRGGPMPPPVVMARMEAADASTRVVPGEQEITAQLHVRFLLR